MLRAKIEHRLIDIVVIAVVRCYLEESHESCWTGNHAPQPAGAA